MDFYYSMLSPESDNRAARAPYSLLSWMWRELLFTELNEICTTADETEQDRVV